MKSDAEYHADIMFCFAKDEPWAIKGFEIARNQLLIANDSKVNPRPEIKKARYCEDALSVYRNR